MHLDAVKYLKGAHLKLCIYMYVCSHPEKDLRQKTAHVGSLQVFVCMRMNVRQCLFVCVQSCGSEGACNHMCVLCLDKEQNAISPPCLPLSWQTTEIMRQKHTFLNQQILKPNLMWLCVCWLLNACHHWAKHPGYTTASLHWVCVIYSEAGACLQC